MLSLSNNSHQAYQAQLTFLKSFEISLLQARQALQAISPEIEDRNQLLCSIEEDMLPSILALQDFIKKTQSPVTDIKINSIKILCERQQKAIADFLEILSHRAAIQQSPVLLLSTVADTSQTSQEKPVVKSANKPSSL